MIQKTLMIGLLILTSISCQNIENEGENGQLSSDVIHNPNTAQKGKTDIDELPVLTFDHTTFDFGLIFQGEVVLHKFKFKNTGKSNLILTDVKATCGCTIPTFTKKPVAPGDEGYIEVSFNSEGRKGVQHKSVNVLANTQPNRIELTFTAEIEVPK